MVQVRAKRRPRLATAPVHANCAFVSFTKAQDPPTDVFPSGHERGRSIITGTGDIDLATTDDLLERMIALAGSARRNMGLDPSGVTSIDYAGTRTLTAVNSYPRADGADIALTAVRRSWSDSSNSSPRSGRPPVPAAAPAAAAYRALAADRPAPVQHACVPA